MREEKRGGERGVWPWTPDGYSRHPKGKGQPTLAGEEKREGGNGWELAVRETVYCHPRDQDGQFLPPNEVRKLPTDEGSWKGSETPSVVITDPSTAPPKLPLTGKEGRRDKHP